MDKKKKPEFKYKTKKCKLCGKPDFKNPRALSMHMHIAHDYLDELDIQRIIATVFLGEIKVSQYMKQLDTMTTKEQEEDETIPPVVKKYWKLARAEQNRKDKPKKDLEKKKAELAKLNGKDKKHNRSFAKMNVLAVSNVKSKLKDFDPKSIIGIYIKDLDTYHYVIDAKYDDKKQTIDLQTARSADPKTLKIKSKSGELLTVEKLSYFLENADIPGITQFFINSAKAGGSKLTKLTEDEYLEGVKGVLFTFEYDKAYYKAYMAKYFANRKKEKEKEK